MAGYSKSRATAYGDFYKGKSRTPETDEDEDILPQREKTLKGVTDNIGDKFRKEALKRRLKKIKKAGM